MLYATVSGAKFLTAYPQPSRKVWVGIVQGWGQALTSVLEAQAQAKSALSFKQFLTIQKYFKH